MSRQIGEGHAARVRDARKARGKSRLTPQQIARAKSDQEDGMTWEALGPRFGMDGATLRRAVLGVER